MVKIVVYGKAGEGKTTIAKVIEDALRSHGFNVQNDDIDVICGSFVSHLQDQCVAAIVKKGDVVNIQTVQTRV